MHITPVRVLIPAGSPAVRYLHVTISAPGRPAAAAGGPPPRPGVDVALVLDRSGSMAGSKIALAREAVAHAIRLLDERDHLVVVAYDEEVDTVLGRTPAAKEAKTLALDRLAAIDARGSTDLAGGWFRAAELLQRPAGETRLASTETPRVTRVLLLTDGHANVGLVDHDALAAEAAALRARGVTTSTFGLGVDFDEDLLSRVATQGGGHFYFIEQPAQIPDVLASELGETLDIIARDVVLEVSHDSPIEVTCLNDYPAATQPGGIRLWVGDMVADQEIGLVLAVACPAAAVSEHIGVSLCLQDAAALFHPLPFAVEWRAVEADENAAQPVNPAVLVEVAQVLAARARAAALRANREGKFAEAVQVLRQARARIQEACGDHPGTKAMLRLLAEEEGEMAEAMSPVTRKMRHAMSHAAMYSRVPGGRARRTGA